MELEEQMSNLYKPSLEEGEPQPRRNFNHNLEEVQLMCVDQCDGIQEMDDLQLVGAPEDPCIKDDDGAVRQDRGMVDVEVKLAETGTAMARVKQKAGRRPPRGGKVKTTARQPPPGRRKTEEEDVCFICFDGGSLVLCDRKGCPKAYHPACIKREESFFRSKAKWNCGWHICSICEKASYYMCYTCTYSLCKGCTKGADYYSLRGNKGFCGICMRTIMLIENCAPGNQEKVVVDFDDKTSWEYLFKVYWIFLKEKLSLTLDELTGAKNPWKEPAITAPKGKSSCQVYNGDCSRGLSSENFCGDLDANHAKRRKTKKQAEFPNQLHSEITDNSGGVKGMRLIKGAEWATDELLELVALMRNGDTSMMSQFDVQSLLLEYIKINNLRDPCRKSQIVCDSRLLNLFGKPRVGHFEMLKLLESHFFIHEHSPVVAVTGVVDAAMSKVESDENHDNRLMTVHDKRRKTSKKADKRGQPNPNEYAAIDVHNVNLIYLKRCLVENLIDETDKFNDKVVGSIVRIRLPVSDQKQDIYRLVQVVGTSKVGKPYKIGDRTADVILEIRNLQKKEVVAIDAISNQEFSEDECSRLRQSIKCGFIKHLTVGEIQEKAMSLQALRVNDLLESEILRLNNLRDRASEKGHRKELRELVEKLEILNSPEERKRRLLEIPEVHVDPKMDPSYESEEDTKEFNEDIDMKPWNPSIGRKEMESSLGSEAQKCWATTLEGNTNISMTDSADGDGTTQVHQGNGSPGNQGKELFGSENNQVGSTIPVIGGWNDNAVQRPETLSEVSSGELSLSNSPGQVQPSIDFETERVWHYQDPAGRVQGPFSMVELRKWSTSGCFPPDFRVWRISQKRDDSLLLTDVLNGQYDRELLFMNKRCLVPQEVRAASDEGSKTGDCEGFGSIDTAADKECKIVDGSLDSIQNDGSALSKSDDEDMKSNGGVCQFSTLTTAADVNSGEGKVGSLLQVSDPLKDNHSLPDQPPMCNSLSSPILTEKSCETMLHQVKEKEEGEKCKSDRNSLRGCFHQTTEGQTDIGNGYDKQVDSKYNSGQSSGQNCRCPAIQNSSNGCDSNSAFVSFTKTLEMPDQSQEIDFSDLPSPTPKSNRGDLKSQDAGIKQSPPSEAPVGDSGPRWGTASCSVDGGGRLEVASPTPKLNHGDLKRENAGIKQSLSSEAPIQDSGPSWSTASGPVGGGSQLVDVAGDCQEIDFSDLPSPTPKSNHGDMKGKDAGIGQSLPSTAPVQDSGPSWSTASSQVGGRPHLPDVSGEWGGYSPTPAKPSVDEWDSNLVPESSLKSNMMASDHAATPTSGSCQPTHSSPSHPSSNAASWQAMVVPEPDEFTTLGDESVSDLLAEVEAMESLNRFASPTSDMRCGMEFSPENDCFSPIGGLSPTPDAGKSDALSSSSDLQVHSHSTVTDEPIGVSQAEVLDPHKRSDGRSSMSAEVEEDTKPSDDSINQCEVGSKIQPALPPVTSWDITAMDASWSLGSETASISQGAVHGNSNLAMGGFSQERIEDMGLGAAQWTAQEHFDVNMGTSIGNPDIWESHPRYVGDRLSGPRDHGFHGGDSSFERGSSVWNGQAIYDVENGGGCFRLPPERQ
ncbi:zinc finger CCCH domain-containing protein 44 isoform X2 [Citrus sinensis]|uniref:zinc finger CCCH domain-containing protein 44 isoform X2 n=1 Tax=Citrus sinensis TaxID=2711 RepID=UPI0003D791D5|nr:zinc finger CCCH domain-containing protein 44 isoform X2 [Citrus sinensis]